MSCNTTSASASAGVSAMSASSVGIHRRLPPPTKVMRGPMI
jgi:hypothetical protein